MKCFTNSPASPVMHLIRLINLPIESSILFLTDSVNIEKKYATFNGLPSKGSIVTCGAVCSLTSVQSKSAIFPFSHTLMINLLFFYLCFGEVDFQLEYLKKCCSFGYHGGLLNYLVIYFFVFPPSATLFLLSLILIISQLFSTLFSLSRTLTLA